MTRVVHAVLSLDVGGLERIVLDLARIGRHRGESPVIVTVDRPGQLAAVAEASGVPVVCLNADASGRSAARPRVEAVLARLRPGVVHTHQIGAAKLVVPAARRLGIPYLVVDGHPKVPVVFSTAAESDPGPYPIPFDAPIEGAGAPNQSKGDRHVLVVDLREWKLYELFAAQTDRTKWLAGSGAVFDLTHGTTRPQNWTSADAAGLPILPGLVRYDEVYERGEISHALRFTVPHSRKAFVPPATHHASANRDELLPPMGMRVRLRAEFELDGYPEEAKVILRALHKYGMFLADNGMAWGLTGTADARWPRALVESLKTVRGADFEVVRMTDVVAG